MEIVFDALLSYLINLAASFRYQALADRQERIQETILANVSALNDAVTHRSLREQLKRIGTKVARSKAVGSQVQQRQSALDVPDQCDALVYLFCDNFFQEQLANWLVEFHPDKKTELQATLGSQISNALWDTGASEEQVTVIQKEYFEAIETLLFDDPRLTAWRLHLGINAVLEASAAEGARTRSELKEHFETLRKESECQRSAIEASAQELAKAYQSFARSRFGAYTDAQRRKALRRYRELALESCDIIDLANLPEDRHVAVRQLELRRMYVPLRVHVETPLGSTMGEEELARMEARREVSRSTTERDSRLVAEGRVPLGERLLKSRRLVVLGDPGSGKTTMLRWLATAYLLRLKNDPDLKSFPDVATLPTEDWLPIIIRCRDLDPQALRGCLEDAMRQTFRKAELASDEVGPLEAVMRQLLAEGKALLLIDGLDEITDPVLRSQFCHQVESVRIAFPKAPIVVTSRIVGYREMHYRMGRGFEHTTVADLSGADKDLFSRRWCSLTERPERQQSAAESLIRDIHSSDRIERLTSNPMLLTTMALV